jgi:hypothetical protein
MNSPYGLEMVEDCVNCTLRRQSSFCSFSPGLHGQFDRLGHQHFSRERCCFWKVKGRAVFTLFVPAM